MEMQLYIVKALASSFGKTNIIVNFFFKIPDGYVYVKKKKTSEKYPLAGMKPF